MEIPYTVTARPDTGLWNAKLGIWLFLASEVMLFGGLFSAYIFLRLGAGADPEYHWPENQLIVWPGFVNTLVLIFSSITVILAWSALKMRNWGKFQVYMGITVFCAVLFLALKAYEYSGKFKHYGVIMTDGTLVEGHIHGNEVIFDEIKGITIPLEDGNLDFVAKLHAGAASHHGHGAHAGHGHDDHGADAHAAEGEHTTDDHGHDHGAHAEEGSEAEIGMMAFEVPGGDVIEAGKLKSWFKEYTKSAEEGATSVTIHPVGAMHFVAKPKELTAYTDSSATMDGITFDAHKFSDSVTLHTDLFDLRNLEDPEASRAFELLGEGSVAGFQQHRDESNAEFREEFGNEIDPTEDREGRRLALLYHLEKEETDHGAHYPSITIPREEVRFMSNHTPKFNTFYAIYFTLTGLHGLHVIGGIVVLGYFLFFGKKLYLKNPEQMANRVEVGGLFWHFVDLVWIFLFPLMYLL